MSTEVSKFWHYETSYNNITNMIPTNSGALKKRSGTRLVLSDTRKIFSHSTNSELFVFFSDEKYTVISLSDFTVLHSETDLPTDLKFSQIEKALIQIIDLGDTHQGILIPTDDGIFQSDLSYDFSEVTLTAFTGSSPALFIALPGRGMIASGHTLHFSKYNDIFDFTELTNPADAQAPLAGYSQNFAVGFDGDIVDIIFYKNILYIGTRLAIYQMEYTILNPFADSILRSQAVPKFEKVVSTGLENRTFTDMGEFTIFAGNRGIYGIDTSSSRTYAQYFQKSVTIVEFTEQAEHITYEDKFRIVQLANDFRRDNVFFALRNDGILFECCVTRQQNEGARTILFTRFMAGEDEKTMRSYISIDHNGRTFVTEREGLYYLEFNHQYPYLNDNKKIFSWNDNLENASEYAFLDCYRTVSDFVLNTAIVRTVGGNEIETIHPLTVSESYFYYAENRYSVFTVKTKNNNRYITDTNFHISEIYILGRRFNQTAIDVSELDKIAKGQKVYVTFANINEYPMRMETVEFSSDTHLNSFFFRTGFGYDGVLEIFIRSNENTMWNPLFLNYFATDKLESIAFTEEGIERTTVKNVRYKTTVDQVIQSTVEWKNYEFLRLQFPVGYSGCLISLSYTNTDNQQQQQQQQQQ